MRRLLAASLLLLAAGAPPPRSPRAPAPASTPPATVATDHAGAIAEENRLAALRVAAAARLRVLEDTAADRAAETETLAARRDSLAAGLAARSAALAPLLPLMERLALYPSETLLAVPAKPEDALRGLGILRGMARTLEAEAAALRREQQDLAAQQAALEASVPKLRDAQAAQAAEAAAIDAQLAAAGAARQRSEAAGAEAARRAAAEAARAETLRAALAALEDSRARAEAQARDDATRAERRRNDAAATEARRRAEALAPPATPAPQPGAQLVAPVAGAVSRAWGDHTDAGPATGMTYRAAPLARVVAPCGGRVRFAGPFRSYGALVILDCGGGAAFVLAGMARLEVAAGATVLPGEPVGAMPAWDPATAGPRPALYLELRRDGQPVNPAPFLRTRG